MFKLKKLLVPLGILALLAFLMFHLTKSQLAPDVTFVTIENKEISMASLKGKVVLVNFWATDCTVCVSEMPDLINTYNAYKAKGFEVIAIAMPYDPPAQLHNYVTQKALPFPVMHDGFGQMVMKFGGVPATPTAYIFDKQGKQIQYTTGRLDFTKLHELLNRELI
jgi:thiol-disulfide isomerase/thioredoxin